MEQRDDDETVVHMAVGRGRYALVRDPEAIWQVLVTDGGSFVQGKWKRRAKRFLGPTLNTLDGAEHRERRQLLQPSVSRARVERFGRAAIARAESAQQGWTDGARIELRSEIDPLALAIGADVLLSTDLGASARPLAVAARRAIAGVPRLTPPVAGTGQRRALAQIEQLGDELISERRRGAPGDGDLIDCLLAGDLSQATMRGDLVAFLLAVVDEPPSALEAAWYLLAMHPGAERRLHDELDSVPGSDPIDPAALPYLDAVLRETLRLFPPARHIDRCPVRDVRVGADVLPAGANVLVSPLVTHREPGLHDRASDFAPERWLDAARAGRRGAYVPFGAGVHTCIGEPLARMTMTSCLAAIARRWRLLADPEAPPPRPGGPGLHVTLERR